MSLEYPHQGAPFANRPLFVKINRKEMLSPSIEDQSDLFNPADEMESKGSILVPYHMRKYNPWRS